MEPTPVRREFVVTNLHGLHLRPADTFSRLAQQFACKVELVKDGERFNAKSVWSLLALAATHGTVVVVEAEGDDAEQAVRALCELAQRDFDEPAEAPESDEPPGSQHAE